MNQKQLEFLNQLPIDFERSDFSVNSFKKSEGEQEQFYDFKLRLIDFAMSNNLIVVDKSLFIHIGRDFTSCEYADVRWMQQVNNKPDLSNVGFN